jgi:hypothetical protein
MIVCEHAESSRTNPHRVNVFGIVRNVVVQKANASFPHNFGFEVYVALTECRGPGTARIIVSHEESGQVCYGGVPHIIPLDADLLRVQHMVFRVPQCELPGPGLYWIELEIDGVVLKQEPIIVVVR